MLLQKGDFSRLIMAERGRWNERAEAVPFPPGLPGGLRLCPFAGASHRLRLMRRRAEGEWFFPLQKKQEVESEEKSEKSSFFDRDTTNLYNSCLLYTSLFLFYHQQSLVICDSILFRFLIE